MGMTVCRDTSELYIYYIVPSNYDRIDMKPQKISSSPVSYCTETCAHINSCRKKKKKKTDWDVYPSASWHWFYLASS